MIKRQKLEPCIINSRQALEGVVADVIKLKLEHTLATASMEREIADVQKRHQDLLLNLARQIEAKEAGVFVYCQQHRSQLFPEKKSLDLLLASVGFETTPPRVEKVNSKDTFGKIGLRLESLDWALRTCVIPNRRSTRRSFLRTARGSKLSNFRKLASESSRMRTFSFVPNLTWLAKAQKSQLEHLRRLWIMDGDPPSRPSTSSRTKAVQARKPQTNTSTV
jgi:hypothetical protein